MDILRAINSSNYVAVNKDLIKLVGFVEAGLLGELASEYNYWLEQGKLDDGWFYSTVENIEKNLGLSKYEQSKSLKKLQAMGLVDFKLKGLPARRYIKILAENLEKALEDQMSKNLTSSGKNDPTPEKPHEGQKSKFLTSGSQNFSPLEVKNFDHCISYNKNKINKNNIYFATTSNAVEKKSIKKLNPPNNEAEVVDYFNRAGITTNPIKFYWYYQGKAWEGINNWQMAAKAWSDVGSKQTNTDEPWHSSLSKDDINKV